MPELSIEIQNKTISSLEIAAVTGEPHDNVKEDIQYLHDQLNQHPVLTTYINFHDSEIKVYYIYRKECDLLMQPYPVASQAMVVKKWEEIKTLAGEYLSLVKRLEIAELQYHTLQNEIQDNRAFRHRILDLDRLRYVTHTSLNQLSQPTN